MEYIAAAAQGTIIAGFLAGVFSFMILKPLNNSIEELRRLITTMQSDIDEMKKRQQDNEILLTKASESAKSAHHRLDDMNKSTKWEN